MHEDRARPLAVDALPNRNHALPDAVGYLLRHGPDGAQPRIPVGNKIMQPQEAP